MAESAGTAAPTTTAAAHATNGNGREVLVVEDDPEINQMVCAYAELAGFSYRSALSGIDALAAVRDHAPSLIVLDLMLPDLNGFDVCRRVKQDPHSEGVPIVILTALDSEDARKTGLTCGASAYLTKPFDPDELMREMNRYASAAG